MGAVIDLNEQRDLAGILNAAYKLYTAHFAVFVTIAAAVVVPLTLLGLGMIDGYLWSDFDRDSDSILTQLDVANSIVTAFIVTPLVTAGAVLATIEISAGREPSARASLEAAGQLLWTLIGTIVLVAGGVILGLFALIIPGIYLMIRWVLSPQAVVAENLGPTDAIRRSGELVAGTWWRVLGITIVVGLLAYGVGGILSFPFMAIAAAADVGALYVVGTMIANTISLPIAGVGMAFLFFDLRARKSAAGPPAP